MHDISIKDTTNEQKLPEEGGPIDTNLDTVENSELNIPTQIDASLSAPIEQLSELPNNISLDRGRNVDLSEPLKDNSGDFPTQLSTPKTRKLGHSRAGQNTEEAHIDIRNRLYSSPKQNVDEGTPLKFSGGAANDDLSDLGIPNFLTNNNTQTDAPIPNLSHDDTPNILDNMNYSPPDTPESQRIILDSNVEKVNSEAQIEPETIQVGQTQDIGNEFHSEVIDTPLDTNGKHSPRGSVKLKNVLDKIEESNPTKNTSKFTKMSFHRRESSNLKFTDDVANIFNDDSEQGANSQDDKDLYEAEVNDGGNTSNYWVFKNVDQTQLTTNAEKTTQMIPSVKTDELETQPIMRAQAASTVVIDTQMGLINEIPDPSNDSVIPDPVNSSINDIIPDQVTHANKDNDEKNKTIISSDKPQFISTQATGTANEVPRPAEPFKDIVDFNQENVILVPNTSSPSKVLDEKDEVITEANIQDSVSSPERKSAHTLPKSSVYLKVSSNTALNVVNDNNSILGTSKNSSEGSGKFDNIVVSDVETTQEFPDVPDSPDSSKIDMEESQIVTTGRRTRLQSRSPRNDVTELHDNSQQSQEPVSVSPLYPSDIRTSDPKEFSKSDISFPNSVWCYYENLNFYPGMVEEKNSNSKVFPIRFEHDFKDMTEDDLFYLDLRIGDTITYMSDELVVTGLECITNDPHTIRCIRGYDTVYAINKYHSKVRKDPIKIALASICISWDEWNKKNRDNLKYKHYILPQEENIQHSRLPTKRRSTMESPLRQKRRINYSETSDDELEERKANIEEYYPPLNPFYESQNKLSNGGTSGTSTQGSLYRTSSSENSKINSTYPKSSGSLNINENNHTTQENKPHDVFENCIFALSGFDSETNFDLKNKITTHGGKVIDDGFSALFTHYSNSGRQSSHPKPNLLTKWKNQTKYADCKFACLITDGYSRKLKYLETLALGWPVLHWKFIFDSLKNNNIEIDKIMNYLLPSGESSELDYKTSKSVIKSSNIFPFYTNLIRNILLENQVGLLNTVMQDYIVIKCGQSPIKNFVKFSFSCLGVQFLYDFSSEKLIQSVCSKANETSKIFEIAKRDKKVIMFYLDIEGDRAAQEAATEHFKEQLGSVMESTITYHVWYKEWLVQTIINGTTGLS